MNLKALVAEPEQQLQAMVETVLKSFRISCLAVSDGRRALEEARRQKFDGIIVGLDLPGIDGLEVLTQIRKSSWNTRVPVIMIGSPERRTDMGTCFREGATFYLEKPFDREKLARLLNSTRGALLDERRRASRVSLLCDVSCRESGRQFSAKAANISQGGMGLQTAAELLPGKTLELSFRLPGNTQLVSPAGVVAWSDANSRAGITFTQLAGEDRTRIHDYVDSVILQ